MCTGCVVQMCSDSVVQVCTDSALTGGDEHDECSVLSLLQQCVDHQFAVPRVPRVPGRVSILRCEGSVIRGMSGESAQIWTSCPPCPHLFKLYRKLSCTYKNIVLTNNVF